MQPECNRQPEADVVSSKCYRIENTHCEEGKIFDIGSAVCMPNYRAAILIEDFSCSPIATHRDKHFSLCIAPYSNTQLAAV